MTEWTARFSGYSSGWTIYGHDENGEYLVAENIGPYADDEEAEAEAEREARLIAAAPTMAEALEPFAHYCDLNDLDERDPDDALVIPVRDLIRARAALRLAKGEDRHD
jgi:hypothetical protein